MSSISQKKRCQFRNSIRRNELQELKKTRRKQILEFTTSMPIEYNNDQKLYQKVLQFHQLHKLLAMNHQQLNNHLQMLLELVYSQNSFIFNDAFDKILTVLIDFYEEIGRQSEMVFRQHIREDCQSEVIQYFITTNIFHYLDAYKFFKVMVAIYYQINPSRNIDYLQKAIRIAKSAMRSNFLDNSESRKIIQKRIPTRQDFFQKNKAVNQYIITLLLNITYSQQQQILQIIVRQGIFDDLSGYAETYGLPTSCNESAAGLYQNCIEYLCSLVHQFPFRQELDELEGMNNCKINTYYLHISLFQYFIGIQEQAIMRHMVYTSQKLIKACLESIDQLKKQIFDKVYDLIANIVQKGQYMQGSEQLFILFANQYKFSEFFSPNKLIQFLHIIFHTNIKLYFAEYTQPQKIRNKTQDEQIVQGKTLRHIRRIFEACRYLISRTDIACLQFHQLLVQQVMSFWTKQELIMGEDQLLAFMQVAIQTGKQLSDFLIFGNNQQVFTLLMATDYQQDKQIHAIILLINAVVSRLEEGIQNQTQRKYLAFYRNQMETIKQRLQSYSLIPSVESNPHLYQISLSLGQKINQLVSIAINE